MFPTEKVHRPNQIVLGNDGAAFVSELGHRQGTRVLQNCFSKLEQNPTKTGQWLVVGDKVQENTEILWPLMLWN